MAYQSEIEKLERRWQENPEQYFAPLADAYRKTGSVEQAIELVRAGLERRPNYVSAHIVLGRCLIDSKSYDEAADEFAHVLELDSENIIALSNLGQMAERKGLLEDATSWYQRLLEVDPMNEDAEEGLERIKSGETLPPLEEPETAEAEAGEVVEETAAEPAAPAAAQAPPAEPTEVSAEPEPSPAPVEETPEPVAAEPEPVLDSTQDEIPETPPPAGVELGATMMEEPATEEAEALESTEVDMEPVDVRSLAPEETEETREEEPVVTEPERALERFSVEGDVIEAPPISEASTLEMDAAPSPQQEPETAETDEVPGEPVAEVGAADEAVPVAADDQSLAAEVSEPVGAPVPESEEEVAPERPEEQAEEAAPAVSEFQVEKDEEIVIVPEREDEEVGPTGEVPAGPGPLGGLEIEKHEEPFAAGVSEDVESAPRDEDYDFVARTGEYAGRESMMPLAPEEAEAAGSGAEAEQPSAAPEDSGLPLISPDEGGGRPEQAPQEEPEPEPVTETMAELYAQQGHYHDAREVYEKLLEADPGDERLKAKLAEIDRLAVGDAAVDAPSATMEGADAGGEMSVREFLAGILSNIPVPSGDTADTGFASEASAEVGEPTSPAGDELTLGSVFGGPTADANLGAGPASDAQANISYDEFFGGEDEAGEAPAESQESGEQDAAPGDQDDFQGWLKRLKS